MGNPEMPPRTRSDLISENRLGSGTPSRADLLISLINNRQFITDNFTSANFAEVDVRPRFQRLRYIRATFVIHLVKGVERAWDDLQNDVTSGRVQHTGESTVERFNSLILDIDQALKWDSENRADDSQAAEADVPDSYFMDKVVRRYMSKIGTNICAPNAEPNTFYGKIGDPISPDFSTIRGSPSDPVRRVILDKLTVPFYHYVLWPLEKSYAWLLGREQPVWSAQLEGRTLDVLVATLTTLISASCLAGSVGLLYKLQSKPGPDRIVAAFFASVVCAIPAAFLGEMMGKVSVLLAGIWAVLTVIVFYSDQNAVVRPGSVIPFNV
ncbi:unnamed protein product [Periconia digitata]|uniref:Uncharacterized protein n=1 Tax=Periconia digitata TaxID=1303443 RepID=A0A9W4U5X8_9PLEO|nr:unnamed protein product [Periconia digitata]